jgi:hypothetical protein
MQASSPPTAAFNGGNASEQSFKTLRAVTIPSKATTLPALAFSKFFNDMGDVDGAEDLVWERDCKAKSCDDPPEIEDGGGKCVGVINDKDEVIAIALIKRGS